MPLSVVNESRSRQGHQRALTLGERSPFTPLAATLSGSRWPGRGIRAACGRLLPPAEVIAVPFYEFIVRDDPDIDFADFRAETGLRCSRSGRTARLDGELIDSAALQGVLARLFRLGVDLVAIERRPERRADARRAAASPSRTVMTP